MNKQGFNYHEKDVENTNATLNAIANLGILSAGAGVSYAGLNGLIKRLYEKKISDIVEPSQYVRNAYNTKRMPITNELVGDITKEGLYKKALYKQALWPFLIKALGVGALTVAAKEGYDYVRQDPKANWGYTLTGTYPVSAMDREAASAVHKYNPDELDFGERVSATLSANPAWRPMWALPLATAAIYGGLKLGKGLTKHVDNNILGEPDNTMPYYSDAKAVYDASANYLKAVANKDKNKKKDKDRTKAALFGWPSEKRLEGVSGDGSYESFGLLNPWLYAGILGAGLTARQIKNFSKGYSSIDNELSDRTNMIRSWQAAKNERRYNYTDNLETELLLEPTDKDPKLKEIVKREKELLKSIQPDLASRLEQYNFDKIRD